MNSGILTGSNYVQIIHERPKEFLEKSKKTSVISVQFCVYPGFNGILLNGK